MIQSKGNIEKAEVLLADKGVRGDQTPSPTPDEQKR